MKTAEILDFRHIHLYETSPVPAAFPFIGASPNIIPILEFTVSRLHKRLAFRLALGALLAGLLAGLVTLFIESERVDDTILSLATQEAAAYSRQAPGIQRQENRDQISALLDDFLRTHQANPQGHFVMVEIYDPDRKDIAQADNMPPLVEQRIETGLQRFPKDADPWYRKIVVGPQIYLQVMIPLFTTDNKAAGFFEGVYHIPAMEVRAITGRVTGTVVLTVLVALLTTLALYPIIIGLHREQEHLSHDLLTANLDILAVLGSAIAKRDSDTHAHNFRVTLYALGLAERAGLEAGEMRKLMKGSWLHDVGKIAISDTILLKPGRLDEAEFSVMKTHVNHGLDIIAQSKWLEDAAQVVGGHHEKWDGSGYPRGLSGEEIPLNARIFALADVFDALTSRRPYKKPMSMEAALEIMAPGRGSHFDPKLYDLFVATVAGDYESFGGREDDRARILLFKRARRYFFGT